MPVVGLVVGLPRIYIAELRASAAIALGNYDDPQARQALVAVLSTGNDQWSDLYKGQAILSLARYPDGRSLTALIETLSPKGGIRSKEYLDSPLRGYAAIALGLYARPVPSPQGPVDRGETDRVCRILADRLADRYDTLEVRTACAVALGLSARTENLQPLQRAINLQYSENELLSGYVLLGRGLLGDGNILGPARQLLQSRSPVESSGILARRAAALSVGLLGRQEGVPILRQAWGVNCHIDREITLALALCSARNASTTLTEMLATSNDPQEQSHLAYCLGELFVSPWPCRLARFLAGSNYMLRNDVMVPYEAMANEFLMRHLVEQFGDQWR